MKPLETSNLKLETSYRHPADLHPHPKLKNLIGRWKPDSAESVEMRRSILRHGIRQPIEITKAGEILDGITRWQCAKALQIDVPCRVVSDDDAEHAVEIALETEIHRRHSTKAQRVFRLAPWIAETFREAEKAKLSLLARGPIASGEKAAAHFKGVKTKEDWASELQVGLATLKQGFELHELLEKHNTPRKWTSGDCRENMLAEGMDPDAEYTPREYISAMILREDKPMGLGGALTAIQTLISQDRREALGKPHRGSADVLDDPNGQLRLFRDGWDTLGHRWEFWSKLEAPAREKATESIRKSLSAAPDDLLTRLANEVRAEIKRRATGEGN